jgi:TPR repeat protein
LIKKNLKSIIALFAFVSTCLTFPSQANITKAYQAFQNKEYEQAFSLFERSAHIGVIDAQLKLAGMYTKGIGVKTDPVMTYVYLALAVDHGKSELTPLLKKVFNALSTKQQEQALPLWKKYQLEYGLVAFEANAQPSFRQQAIKFRPAKQIGRASVVRKSQFDIRKSTLGSTMIDYDVGADGKTKDIEVGFNYFLDAQMINRIFSETAEKKFRPANIAGNKSNKIKSFTYTDVWAQRRISEKGLKDREPKFYKKVKQLRTSAAEGNAYAQYQMAMIIQLFPTLSENGVVFIDYLNKAAQAGVAAAQVEYAKLLLQGKKVKPDNTLAISYLFSAAQSGDANGQYKLARQLLIGQVIQREEHKAHFWLQQAVEQKQPYAQFWLARLLLVSKDASLRDPNLAKTLLAKVAEQQRHNPNWYFFAALAELKLGNQSEAIDLLNDGKSRAEDLDWGMEKFKKLSKKIKQLQLAQVNN